MNDATSLRLYVRQIDEFVRRGQSDDVIALGKHILADYPKYVHVFEQMGKAYLSADDAQAAETVFLRVLAADPENAAAHIGLVHIQLPHSLSQALWHAECAYDLLPENVEWQDELRRLYAQAGKSITSIELTPAAKARTHLQAGQVEQAARELRAAVTHAPSRFDLWVALAEALWRVDHLREAARVSEMIVRRLPDCLKANLILGTAWKRFGLTASEEHLARAQQLDPLNEVAVKLLGTRSPLQMVDRTIPEFVLGESPQVMAGQAVSIPPVEVQSEHVTAELGSVEEVAQDDEAGPEESIVEEAESVIAQYMNVGKPMTVEESTPELTQSAQSSIVEDSLVQVTPPGVTTPATIEIDHLVLAREYRDANLLHQALAEYDWVVQHSPRQIDDLIRDLEILAQRADAPAHTHHILGDAYARADRLSEALRHYRFVLDHLSES